MHQPGVPQHAHVSPAEAEPAARSRRQLGDRARVPERVGRLEVDEARDRQQRGIEALAGEHDGQRRLGRDHRVPRRDVVQARQQQIALLDDKRRQRRVELPAGALTSQPLGAVDTRYAMRHLDELRELREPRGDRHRVALDRARPTAAIPPLVRRAEGIEDRIGKPDLLPERPRALGVVLDHAVNLPTARDGELEP